MTEREQVRQKITAAAGALKDAVDELVKLDEAAERATDRMDQLVEMRTVPADVMPFSTTEIRDRSVRLMQDYKHSEISLNAAFFQLCDVVYGLAAAVAEMDKGRNS